MASVFLSYDREDTDRGQRVAHALEKAGHSVWWDRHIKSGAQYGREIDEALKRADAVVVLWSEKSIDSAWVRDEAAAGRDAGKLVPVLIDKVHPPLGFRQYQTTDLTRWKGRANSREFHEMLEAVEALGGRESAVEAGPAKSTRRTLPVSWPWMLGIVAIALLAAALYLWRPWDRRSAIPLVAVVPAQQTPAAKALADDLLVKLGNLQATNPDSVRLAGSVSEQPDLILEVNGASQARELTATLVLLGGKDRTVFWSSDFKEPNGRDADLRQQIAYSAAQVLDCAAEAASAETKISNETRKLYLNGCSQFAVGSDASVVPVFEKVTRAAPQFRDAWAKLLLSASNLARITRMTTGDYRHVAASLGRHIAEARRRHGEIPEVLLAQLELRPSGAFAERLRLVDRAKDLGPDNPYVLLLRSQELMSVGRQYEAIRDAERAVQLDPLSPGTRNQHISALAYSGRLTAAADALQQAERIWPGSASVLDAKFRFHLRYGDPAVALRLYRAQQGTLPVHELTLIARLNRTPENVDRAVRMATVLLDRFGDIGMYSQVLAEFGREDEIYATLARTGAFPIEGTDVLFRPTLKKFREDRRFMVLVKRMGLLDYWRASGKWPDFCLDPDLPYDCKAEAAKLAA